MAQARLYPGRILLQSAFYRYPRCQSPILDRPTVLRDKRTPKRPLMRNPTRSRVQSKPCKRNCPGFLPRTDFFMDSICSDVSFPPFGRLLGLLVRPLLHQAGRPCPTYTEERDASNTTAAMVWLIPPSSTAFMALHLMASWAEGVRFFASPDYIQEIYSMPPKM